MKGRVRLADFDPDYCGGLDKDDTKKRTHQCTRRIAELQELLFANSRQALLLIFQGLDASGKDGAIRNVLRHVNPAGVETAYFKVPSAEEKAHDFLWRVHREVPRYGNIGVFNRSHYEAVLAERVLVGLKPASVKHRFRQIVDFERMLTENNVIIVKFYLHLGFDEQAKRFSERLEIPRKKWKFSSADLETRRRWNDFIEAYEDVLTATSQADARWHLVPSNHNWYRNYVVASTVVATMESLKLKWPKPKEDLAKIRIK